MHLGRLIALAALALLPVAAPAGADQTPAERFLAQEGGRRTVIVMRHEMRQTGCLTKEGVRRARLLAASEWFKNRRFDAVITANECRTIDTAKIIARRTRTTPLTPRNAVRAIRATTRGTILVVHRSFTVPKIIRDLTGTDICNAYGATTASGLTKKSGTCVIRLEHYASIFRIEFAGNARPFLCRHGYRVTKDRASIDPGCQKAITSR
jgi:phosphohistidine phosphatase SixA